LDDSQPNQGQGQLERKAM